MTKYKAKDENANNLREIRKHLGFTQCQMAEILNVGIDMYRNYERWEYLIPASRAKIIADKYNYSLDYIYKLSEKESRVDQFMVDIRDVVSREYDNIIFRISDLYWEYLHEKNVIQSSNNTTHDKNNKIAELDSKYIPEDNGHIRKLVIKRQTFISMFKSDNEEVVYGFNDNECEKVEIPENRLEEVKNTINPIDSDTNKDLE